VQKDHNMDGTTYDGGGLSVGVSSLPAMTAKQITDEKVETFRQKFMQGHKPWEKIGLFKFPEDKYASVDFALVLPTQRLSLAKKIGIYTRQNSIYDFEDVFKEEDQLIILYDKDGTAFTGKDNKNLNPQELAVVRKMIGDLSKRPSSPEDVREAQEIVDYLAENGHSGNIIIWREIQKADKIERDRARAQHAKIMAAFEKYRANPNKKALAQLRKFIQKYNPPQPITEPPVTATLTNLVKALDLNKSSSKRILGLPGINIRDGEAVSFRLDIPAYTNYDIWVNTIKPVAGPPIYSNISVGNDAAFGYKPTFPEKALNIATGKTIKTPFGVINVVWENQTVEQTEREIAEALEDSKQPNSTWKQIGFNPQRASYFYDKANLKPVASASRVLQVGPLVMAQNVQYAGEEVTQSF